MDLNSIFLFENKPLSELKDSKEKNELLRIKEKLRNLEPEIKEQPEGRITLKESGNIFVTGFETELKNKIGGIIRNMNN